MVKVGNKEGKVMNSWLKTFGYSMTEIVSYLKFQTVQFYLRFELYLAQKKFQKSGDNESQNACETSRTKLNLYLEKRPKTKNLKQLWPESKLLMRKMFNTTKALLGKIKIKCKEWKKNWELKKTKVAVHTEGSPESIIKMNSSTTADGGQSMTNMWLFVCLKDMEEKGPFTEQQIKEKVFAGEIPLTGRLRNAKSGKVIQASDFDDCMERNTDKMGEVSVDSSIQDPELGDNLVKITFKEILEGLCVKYKPLFSYFLTRSRLLLSKELNQEALSKAYDLVGRVHGAKIGWYSNSLENIVCFADIGIRQFLLLTLRGFCYLSPTHRSQPKNLTCMPYEEFADLLIDAEKKSSLGTVKYLSFNSEEYVIYFDNVYLDKKEIVGQLFRELHNICKDNKNLIINEQEQWKQLLRSSIFGGKDYQFLANNQELNTKEINKTKQIDDVQKKKKSEFLERLNSIVNNCFARMREIKKDFPYPRKPFFDGYGFFINDDIDLEALDKAFLRIGNLNELKMVRQSRRGVVGILVEDCGFKNYHVIGEYGLAFNLDNGGNYRPKNGLLFADFGKMEIVEKKKTFFYNGFKLSNGEWVRVDYALLDIFVEMTEKIILLCREYVEYVGHSKFEDNVVISNNLPTKNEFVSFLKDEVKIAKSKIDSFKAIIEKCEKDIVNQRNRILVGFSQHFFDTVLSYALSAQFSEFKDLIKIKMLDDNNDEAFSNQIKEFVDLLNRNKVEDAFSLINAVCINDLNDQSKEVVCKAHYLNKNFQSAIEVGNLVESQTAETRKIIFKSSYSLALLELSNKKFLKAKNYLDFVIEGDQGFNGCKPTFLRGLVKLLLGNWSEAKNDFVAFNAKKPGVSSCIFFENIVPWFSRFYGDSSGGQTKKLGNVDGNLIFEKFNGLKNVLDLFDGEKFEPEIIYHVARIISELYQPNPVSLGSIDAANHIIDYLDEKGIVDDLVKTIKEVVLYESEFLDNCNLYEDFKEFQKEALKMIHEAEADLKESEVQTKILKAKEMGWFGNVWRGRGIQCPKCGTYSGKAFGTRLVDRKQVWETNFVKKHQEIYNHDEEETTYICAACRHRWHEGSQTIWRA